MQSKPYDIKLDEGFTAIKAQGKKKGVGWGGGSDTHANIHSHTIIHAHTRTNAVLVWIQFRKSGVRKEWVGGRGVSFVELKL